MIIAAIGVGTMLTSLVLVWLIGNRCYRYGWVVVPRRDRWHQSPVARYGGVGIACAFFLGVVAYSLATGVIPPREHVAFLVGAFGVYVVGLVDDIVTIKPSTKLIGQIVAVSLPIAAGVIIAATPWYLANVLLTFFWFIGIVNATNLIDNMDGLAAGVVAIALATLLTLQVIGFSLVSQEISVGIAVALLGAVLGFLVFNYHPAKIFMGDAGSLLLGYVLAGLVPSTRLNSSLPASSVLLSLILPVTVLAIPIFDTILVTMSRLWHGRAPSVGGRDHSSHRLVGLGFSERRAVAILWAFSFVGGMSAVALRLWPVNAVLIVGLYATFLTFVGIYLWRVKSYAAPDNLPLRSRWTPMVVDVLYKRRIAEVLLDFILIAGAYYAAFYLRFEGTLKEHADRYIESLPIVIVASLIAFFFSGVYRGIWRFITVADLGRYMQGVLFGTSTSIALVAGLYGFRGYSRAVFIIYGVLLFLLTAGSRLSFRVFDDIVGKRALKMRTVGIFIYGAGRAGRLLYDECSQNERYAHVRVLGFLDDDPGKRHLLMVGVPIYGVEDIAAVVEVPVSSPIELWIASRKIPDDRARTVVAALEENLHTTMFVRRFGIQVEDDAGGAHFNG